MKEKLTIEMVVGKMSLNEVARYYFHDMTDNEIKDMLWNKTCYPFSTEIMLNQIYEMYVAKIK